MIGLLQRVTAARVEVGGEPVVPAADETWLDRFAVCNLMDFDGTWANLQQDRIAIDPDHADRRAGLQQGFCMATQAQRAVHEQATPLRLQESCRLL